MSYFPLWCRSNFSFLEGASHPEELVAEAHARGLPGLALTDRDGLYGMVRAHLRARALGLRLIVGADVSVAIEGRTEGEARREERKRERTKGGTTPRERRRRRLGDRLLLLARNETGYRNLSKLLTRSRLRGSALLTEESAKPPSSPRKGAGGVSPTEIAEHADGLCALWGGDGSSLLRNPPPDRTAARFREAFGARLHLLLTRHRRDRDRPEEVRMRSLAARYRVPLAAATEVLYHRPERRALQDVLTAIRHGVSLDRAGRRTRPNGEHFLRSPADFAALFADAPDAVARTREIADDCRFSLDRIRYRYPTTAASGGMDPSTRLRRSTFAGADRRYPEGVPEEVRRQLEVELGVIEELEYGGYFLTMHEIVRFCRDRGILCQGRGSAANSAVCYCLGITAVDPVRMGLLFERFLSAERASPPDIDLDIMHSRREEVLRFVYRRYGRERAAMVANTVCYRTRSAIREVGKALGFSERSLDRLARSAGSRDSLDEDRLRAVGWQPEIPAVRHLIRLVDEIRGFPRHLSIHPGGFVLGEEPISHLAPVENAAMEGRTVIQWNKDDLEELGIFKVDLLGLGALTQLDLCFRSLRESRGLDLSLSAIPANDPNTFAMIRRAETVGVFQIESRAQMAMLPRLRPRNYYDLVVEVSIVRPGPIAGRMVHPYLRRRRGEEPIRYPHPSLRPVLEKTLGIPLFQEQVMRLAMVAADYTPGEADRLRRDMGAWRRTGQMDRHRDRLVSRMLRKGIDRAFAERVFEQIRGFGEYGFPESHAASFALIAYAGAYLLCHYPAEFVCALLNAQPMGFYSPSTIVEDAKRRGVRFLPVEVEESIWDCSLDDRFPASAARARRRSAGPTVRPAVRMGLRYVKGLGAAEGERIIAARKESPFGSIPAFARRTGLGKKAMLALAEADAFHRLGPTNRRQAVWQALGRRPEAKGAPRPLFREATPDLPAPDALESILWDRRTKRHSTRGHPLAPLRSRLAAAGFPTAEEVAALPTGAEARYAGIVICRQQPGTASGVVFLTLEDETGFVNLILWPDVFRRNRPLVGSRSFLAAAGRIEAERGAAHLVVESLFLPTLPSPEAESPHPPPLPRFEIETGEEPRSWR